MLNRIVQYSLNNRLVVLIAAVLLIFGGIYASRQMDIDVFPDLNAPTVVVMTEAHGMAPEEVEKTVTYPIESTINGANNIRRVRSKSSMGFSIIWAEFDWGTDIYDARQTIGERIVQASSRLPESAGNPVIAPQSSLMGEIIVMGATSDSLSPMELRTNMEWNVRPRLLAVGGVAQIVLIGGDYKEYQILANPLKMKHFNVSADELAAACQSANRNVPGGFFSQHGNRYVVRGLSRTHDTLQIGQTLIKMQDSQPVKVQDVASVTVHGAPRIGAGSIDGKNGVVMTITKQPGINTIKLSEKIHETLDNIENSANSDIRFHTQVFDQAEFISRSVNNVKTALIEGAALVVIILFLFLMNVRTTIISVIALPLSLLTGIIVLFLLDITINTMTLGGMTIAIGSLVDDAIIDVENVYKRLRERSRDKNVNYLKVVYDASIEIRSSILNATLIIIVAFLPLFFLSGMEGRMLQPLGIAYIVALAASLIIAMTVTPVLCSLLLTNKKSLAVNPSGSWVERNLKRIYRSGLHSALQSKRFVILVAVVLLTGAGVLLSSFGNDFLPPLREGALTVNVSTIPGTSLKESEKLGRQAENIMLGIPEISTVTRRTGRAELAEHTFGVNVSELDAPYTLQDRSREAFLADLREQLHHIPGANIEVGQPITHRINHMLSGSQATIAIKLFGANLSEMYTAAKNVENQISDVEGVADINTEQQIEVPQLKIRPRHEMLAKRGISLSRFNRFIEMGLNGMKVGDVFEDEKSFDLVLRLEEDFRTDIDAIGNIPISDNKGNHFPLKEVAEIISSGGPNTISRENVKRMLMISVNVAGRDAGSVVKDIQNKIDNQITLPAGNHIEYDGQFKTASETQQKIMITSILALLIIFVILYQEFKNARTAGIILLNLPLALIGGVAAIQFTSGTLSIPAIIGFITLFGIATRNGILLVSRYEMLLKQGKRLKEAVTEGSADRLSPILMTALTAALALIPLVMQAEKPGNEIQSPMAVVILGGLLSSTLLNAFVIPVVYQIYKSKRHE
ncbi:MAG: efflux RND transporter permease subunit [Bacteroidota bacterium]